MLLAGICFPHLWVLKIDTKRRGGGGGGGGGEGESVDLNKENLNL